MTINTLPAPGRAPIAATVEEIISQAVSQGFERQVSDQATLERVAAIVRGADNLTAPARAVPGGSRAIAAATRGAVSVHKADAS
jgi:hypothetical protein